MSETEHFKFKTIIIYTYLKPAYFIKCLKLSILSLKQKSFKLQLGLKLDMLKNF